MRSPAHSWLEFLVVLALGAALTGCGSDNDEFQTVTPPLVIRSIYPDTNIRDFVGEQDLSVTFDRAPGVGNVIMRLYPTPAQLGEYGPTGSGRNWAWSDVLLTSDDGAYSWLIDAYLMPQPVVIHFASGERFQLVGYSGSLESADPAQVVPEGTLVFALPPDSPFNPLDPATFLEAQPLARAVAVAVDLDLLLDGPATHQFTYMEHGLGSIVVAVKDTNNDLVYDPTSDWWGYHRASSSLAPEIVYAALFGNREEDYNADVSIRIAPPATAKRHQD